MDWMKKTMDILNDSGLHSLLLSPVWTWGIPIPGDARQVFKRQQSCFNSSAAGFLYINDTCGAQE